MVLPTEQTEAQRIAPSGSDLPDLISGLVPVGTFYLSLLFLNRDGLTAYGVESRIRCIVSLAVDDRTSLEADRSGSVSVLRTELHRGNHVLSSLGREESALGIQAGNDGRHEESRLTHGTPTGDDETGRRRLGVTT